MKLREIGALEEGRKKKEKCEMIYCNWSKEASDEMRWMRMTGSRIMDGGIFEPSLDNSARIGIETATLKAKRHTINAIVSPTNQDIDYRAPAAQVM